MDSVTSKTTHPLKTKTINGRNKLIKAKHVSVDSTNEQKEHAGITGRSLLEKTSVRKNSEPAVLKQKPILKGRSESAKTLQPRRKGFTTRRNSDTLSPPKNQFGKTVGDKREHSSSPNSFTPKQLTSEKSSPGSRKPPFSFSPDCQQEARDSAQTGSSPYRRQVSFESDFALRSPSTRETLMRLSPIRSRSIQFEVNEQPDYSLNDCIPNNIVTNSDEVKKYQRSDFQEEPDRLLDVDSDSSLESKENENSEEPSNCTVIPISENLEVSVSDQKNNSANDSATMFQKTDNLVKEVSKLIENFQNLRSQDKSAVLFSQDNVRKPESIPVAPDATTKAITKPSVVEYTHPHTTEEQSISNLSTKLVESSQQTTNEDDSESQFTPDFLSTFSPDELQRKITQTLSKIEQEEMKDFMRHSYDDLRELDDQCQNVNHSFCQFSQAASILTSRSCSRLSCISSCTSHPHNSNCISPRINSSRVSSKPEISEFQGSAMNKNEKYNITYGSSHQLTSPNLSLNTKEQFAMPYTSVQQVPSIHVNDRAPAESSFVPSDDKTKKLFEFLEEVDRSDREALFALKYNPTTFDEIDNGDEFANSSSSFNPLVTHKPGGQNGKTAPAKATSLQTMESLIRKGPVQLAKELIVLERKYEEASQSIRVLEETLLHQRELSMRNIKNSEKDMKKRLKLQTEEFEMAFSRNEALVNEMAVEKRTLQDKLDKLINNFNEAESKYREHVKALQQKHLDEIKRIRKANLQAENSRKQQWVGNKTQEIKELTVKGLEPEVQRIIQRHQQEMNELRAWHADEIREIEDRYQRKLNMHQQENREKFAQELDLALAKEKETAKKRLEAEMKLKEDEFEVQKRRLENEVEELRDRLANNELRWKDHTDENVRKVQIKAEIEQEQLKDEFETKILGLSRKHENEIQTLKEIYEAEKENIATSCAKRYEEMLKDNEKQFAELKRIEIEKELREKERQLRDEFERSRREDEEIFESRMRRTQDKLQSEIAEMDQREKELKMRLNNAKTEILRFEEDIFSFKASLGQKDKQIHELQDANLRMSEERVNLTSVIRREFSVQIETVEEEVRSLKSKLVDLQAKHTLELEQKQAEVDKILHDKSLEIEKIGFRVQQTISGREETIHELQKQLETSNFHIHHLESLLEQQRKDMIDSMTRKASATTKRK